MSERNHSPDNAKLRDAPLKNVEGRLAVITGGSSGIGLGIAKACSSAGMNVVITYLTEAHLREAEVHFRGARGTFGALRLDVSDREAVARAADEVTRRFGAVHLLCNNAGVGLRTRICEATYDDWDFAMGVNVWGVVNMLQSFLPGMLRHGEPAHVACTASMSGLVHVGGSSVYTTTKFAVVGMMEALRAELMPRGIGVSAFCPGLVRTNILLTERNRRSAARPATRNAASPAIEAMVAAGMDPFECGEKFLEGVRRNELYILTHPEFEHLIGDRCRALTASVARNGGEAPPRRLQVQQALLKSTLYASDTGLSDAARTHRGAAE